MSANAEYQDERIKHLEMIQDVVTRIANSSGATKRLAIFVFGAGMSLALTSRMPALLGFACLPIVTLAFLDANYLRLERGFRKLYDEVRLEPPTSRPDFRMKSLRDGMPFWNALFSWSVGVFYLTLFGALLVSWIFVWLTTGR